MSKKDPFKVRTKTLCHHTFTAVDGQYPCSRAVCECYESYKKRLASSREQRRAAKELATNE